MPTPITRELNLAVNALLPVLVALAGCFLAGGVSASEFERVSRRSFVLAAARRSRFKNGKINHSLVAARTGLSRTEVRRVLLNAEANRRASIQSTEDGCRAVIAAWHADPLFVDGFGRPKMLALHGSPRSLFSLAEKYAAGVAPIAILKALRRRGFLTIRHNRASIRYVPLDAAAFKRLKRLSPLLEQLCLAAAGEEAAPRSPNVRISHIPIQHGIDAVLTKRHAVSTLTAAMQSLGAISRAKTSARRSEAVLLATVVADSRLPPMSVREPVGRRHVRRKQG